MDFGGQVGAEDVGFCQSGEAWMRPQGTVAVVVPAGVIHDRVEADAEDFCAEALGLTDFGGDVTQPAWAGVGFGAGFL